MPYPLCHFVYFNVQEVQIGIKVLVFEEAFTDHLRKEIHNIASAINNSLGEGNNIRRNCSDMMQFYLVGHLPLEVHSEFDHVIVRGSGEEDFSSVKLV